jgi:hypothetical protein
MAELGNASWMIQQGRFLLLQNPHSHHPWWSDAELERYYMDVFDRCRVGQ